MTQPNSAGARFRAALQSERPLQIVGVINALGALLAQRAGFGSLYISGAGVANASLGMPDLGMTTLDDVLADVRRITRATDLPVLVDADTGWGDTSGIQHTVTSLIEAGAAGLHLEDQVEQKRCGHRPGKVLVSDEAMVDRVEEAVAARTDPQFVIMARTDAYTVEGLDCAIQRSLRYVEAGADMIFAEAMADPTEYQQFTRRVPVPVLANLTEFGRTPLFTLDQMREVGVGIVLYPLSALRAMNQAARQVYDAIRQDGTQSKMLPAMQTRDQLYDLLDYHRYEQQLDQRLQQDPDHGS
ncbi:MAG: methylisocitrate lyase [Planctomycetaceae bacterium]|nr:methylisocitrate lyase [Planctomycetaceae bacterium]